MMGPPLVKGVLIQRHKRFLVDVRLEDGQTVTAHCPNTGSMMGCSEPGRPVWLSVHRTIARRTPFTWEFIEMPTSLVGINTHIPNRVVGEAVSRGEIIELGGYPGIRREVRSGPHTRLDLMLSAPGRVPCWVEVKNCTLVEDGVAMFPDAVTERGRKHLQALLQCVEAGHRGVLFILVQRMDARIFRPADRIDPTYGRLLREVLRGGVELLVYDVIVDLEGVRLRAPLQVDMEGPSSSGLVDLAEVRSKGGCPRGDAQAPGVFH